MGAIFKKERERQPLDKKKALIFVLTILFSAIYIWAGSLWAHPQSDRQAVYSQDTVKAQVSSIIAVRSTDVPGSTDAAQSIQYVYFRAKILSGPDKGGEAVACQIIDPNYYPVLQQINTGDKVLISPNTDGSSDAEWTMLEYLRSDVLIVLTVIFALCLLLFGRWKGLHTLIALTFTCLAVFSVFVPSVLNGRNIYAGSIVTCLFVIVSTMLLINGACAKSFAAGAGCFGGVAIAGLLTVIMDKALRLTGMIDEDTLYLQLLNPDHPIDLHGVVFAAIIIGAMGAIMDVAMDIASSLNELKQNAPDITPRGLVASGLNIGRDIMGTMANTLVLAYIGSGLCLTLLMAAYNDNLLELFNLELIVVTALQALAGSFGILLTIPLTSLFCVALYCHKKAVSHT
ncbi:MAG: YibE/F family protein [Firmicutes bacterium]|nr:YibE/F family protein [Bacillota bacterium]